MKADWDKLMVEYKGNPNILVADVDCTAGGKSLCTQVGVRGYPSLKYGDPGDLQDYKGSRSFAELQKFANGLGPQCGPANFDLCSDEKKEEIRKFQALSSEARDSLITEKEQEIQKLEEDYKAFVDNLQKRYNEADEKKNKDIEELKGRGLGLMKAVHAHTKRQKSDL